MFFPKQRLLILEVPKCGSRTLVKACKKEFGHNEFAGHLSIVDVERKINDKKKFNHTLDWEIESVVRIVRDPLDRVVSALNYACKGGSFNLDYLIDQMLKSNPKALNSTQVHWCDSDKYPVHTFKIENMVEALEFLGCQKVDYWENKSTPIINKRDVVHHPRYKEILRRYEPDFELWKQYNSIEPETVVFSNWQNERLR